MYNTVYPVEDEARIYAGWGLWETHVIANSTVFNGLNVFDWLTLPGTWPRKSGTCDFERPFHCWHYFRITLSDSLFTTKEYVLKTIKFGLVVFILCSFEISVIFTKMFTFRMLPRLDAGHQGRRSMFRIGRAKVRKIAIFGALCAQYQYHNIGLCAHSAPKFLTFCTFYLLVF